jgi:hypothetical protein
VEVVRTAVTSEGDAETVSGGTRMINVRGWSYQISPTSRVRPQEVLVDLMWEEPMTTAALVASGGRVMDKVAFWATHDKVFETAWTNVVPTKDESGMK